MLVLSQLITLTKGVYIEGKAENILHQLLAEQDADQCGNTFLHVTVLDDLLNSSTVMYIIERTLQLYETVQKINNQCAIRSLNLLDFPLLSGFKEHASLIRCSDYDNINNLDVDKFA